MTAIAYLYQNFPMKGIENLQPDGVNLWYFKHIWLLELTELIV